MNVRLTSYSIPSSGSEACSSFELAAWLVKPALLALPAVEPALPSLLILYTVLLYVC